MFGFSIYHFRNLKPVGRLRSCKINAFRIRLGRDYGRKQLVFFLVKTRLKRSMWHTIHGLGTNKFNQLKDLNLALYLRLRPLQDRAALEVE